MGTRSDFRTYFKEPGMNGVLPQKLFDRFRDEYETLVNSVVDMDYEATATKKVDISFTLSVNDNDKIEIDGFDESIREDDNEMTVAEALAICPAAKKTADEFQAKLDDFKIRFQEACVRNGADFAQKFQKIKDRI
jgi:hypothetical protein